MYDMPNAWYSEKNVLCTGLRVAPAALHTHASRVRTNPNEKVDIVEDMPKTYDPQLVEPQLIQEWINAGVYQRNKGVGDCTVVIPPPNVTGILHMGHAMDDTIQDTFVRYNRMRGRSTRWILGTDHAGIATQTKVDKKLKSEGISRLAIGREKFLDACWDWTREYGGTIVNQIKRMGSSIDFSDPKFTMSDEYAHAVRTVFVKWYHDGLIYRGKRIVNWCPQCCTAISDDEAEYRDEKGHLWYMRYPLVNPVGSTTYITVATTRPETMLGDTGVAVSPSDDEKAPLVGARVMLPIVNREIEIFSDWHVEKGFGTGFVKVTPAHDPNDYAMGMTHNLEQINIFDEHAHVQPGYGEFSGMDRDECRAAIVRWFDEHGLLDHVEELNHSVMHCYRCDTALEPWLSEQWFVAVDKLKEPALKVVDDGDVVFHPQRWTQTYRTWMENLKDWCISRQLWWGHRIPVFYCTSCSWKDALPQDVDVCPQCGSAVVQDENVLDTWFSSQLWTFATQGWPLQTDELSQHHPTKVLVTARDIIALWVARMIMSSLYFTGDIPFHDVFIYATILAKDGSRMSKSKGNGVDPMELIQKYGADAMRYNLLTLITGNQDVKFDAVIDKKTKKLKESPRTEQARAFVTKIWNASRFVQMNLNGYIPGEPKVRTAEDAWMLSRLARMVVRATSQLEHYEFGDYARDIQTFFRNEVCDWYIELCKSRLLHGSAEETLEVQRNLVFVLDTSLRLMHPVMPHVTEKIWQSLPASALDDHSSSFLMVAPWPKSEQFEQFINDDAERDFELARTVISTARSTRARYRLSPKEQLDVYVKCDAAQLQVLNERRSFIQSVGFISSLTVEEHLEKPAGCVAYVEGLLELYVHVGNLVDLAAEAKRLQQDIEQKQVELDKIAALVEQPAFLNKAKPEIIEQKKARMHELMSTIEKMRAALVQLQ